MVKKYIIVQTHTNKKQVYEDISRLLVEKKMAACKTFWNKLAACQTFWNKLAACQTFWKHIGCMSKCLKKNKIKTLAACQTFWNKLAACQTFWNKLAACQLSKQLATS